MVEFDLFLFSLYLYLYLSLSLSPNFVLAKPTSRPRPALYLWALWPLEAKAPGFLKKAYSPLRAAPAACPPRARAQDLTKLQMIFYILHKQSVSNHGNRKASHITIVFHPCLLTYVVYIYIYTCTPMRPVSEHFLL